MQTNAHITNPMDWSEFERLMEAMRHCKHSSTYEQKKYAMYQVSIACGCFFGPISKELLSIRWKDIIGVGAYIFRYESHRSPIVIPPALRAIIDHNYQLLNPDNLNELVLSSSLHSAQKPVWGKVYNNVLAKIFDAFNIDIPNASYQTLRMTFARHILNDFTDIDEGINVLAKEFNYTIKFTRNYIQI